uniref:Photosystem II 10 kDa polypeptide, chloroplastic n=1 Tax=Oxybasis rubra TaxID=3560 RepID=Q1H8R2_OXYRB|nr:Photosystem II 10 kDa polypeptide, chloroplast precursor [Oxybasis rubra]
MAASVVMSSLSLKPSSFNVDTKAAVKGLPSLSRSSTSFTVRASGGKKIKTDKPSGKGVYQFVDKYGANVDGYSPIYNEEEWSPSGDVYTGGTTGLLIWAVTLAGLLAGGALLVYNTSALAQ